MFGGLGGGWYEIVFFGVVEFSLVKACQEGYSVGNVVMVLEAGGKLEGLF